MAKILVVDDEQDIRETLKDILEKEGYGVEMAGSGDEAISMFSSVKPDLVLMDVRMPGMNGVDLLKKLRQMNAEVPVAMITAYEDVALAEEALGLGAYDYIKKPFDLDYLRESVLSKVIP
jgi:DNA-binding NtrC family response regulator